MEKLTDILISGKTKQELVNKIFPIIINKVFFNDENIIKKEISLEKIKQVILKNGNITKTPKKLFFIRLFISNNSFCLKCSYTGKVLFYEIKKNN